MNLAIVRSCSLRLERQEPPTECTILNLVCEPMFLNSPTLKLVMLGGFGQSTAFGSRDGSRSAYTAKS
jgi:hypothetical protein